MTASGPDLAEHLAQLATERHLRAGRALVEAAVPGPRSSVLELGCGTGFLSRHLARCVGPHGDVLGLDASAYHISIAHQRAAPNLRFQVGSALNLSRFPDGCFDVIVANDVLADWPQPLAPLQACARLLRSGGRLALATRSSDHPHPVEQATQRLLQRQPYADWPVPAALQRHEVNAGQLTALLERAGFQIQSLEAQPEEVVHASLGAALGHVEACQWGRFLAHLPKAVPNASGQSVNLREQARAELLTDLLCAGHGGGLRHEGWCLLVVATPSR